MSLGYHYFSFSSKMSKHRSFFRINTSFTYWLITRHLGMMQLWFIPHSIAYHLPKKIRYRWTKSDEKWRQEGQSNTNTIKKCIIPCIIYAHILSFLCFHYHFNSLRHLSSKLRPALLLPAMFVFIFIILLGCEAYIRETHKKSVKIAIISLKIWDFEDICYNI